MKIYEIGTGYTPIPAQMGAATEIVVEELARSFTAMGEDVKIIDISSSERKQSELPITEVKVPAFFTKSDVSLGIVHKLKRVVYSVALAFKLKKILKNEKEKPILHFHNQYNLFFFLKLVPKKLRLKAVVAYTNHNGLWSLPWQEVEDRLNRRYFQEIEGIKNADIVFVLNSNSKKNIVENLKLDEQKTVLINNGVNIDLYHPLDDEQINRVKEKYNLSGKKVILQVGSVYENKGQDKAVELMSPILKKNSDMVYAFAGEIVSEVYFSEVKAKIKSFGIEQQAVYLGAFAPGEEMNKLYNIADATLFLSRYEGFPLVCIESISAGVPVIMRNSLTFDMSDGCLKFENDVDFEKAVFSVTGGEEREEIFQNSRMCAENKYSWNKTAEEYIRTFRSSGKEEKNA